MIHHVTRETPPTYLADCVAFYAILDFTEAEVPPGIAGRAVWLERAAPIGQPVGVSEVRQQVHLMPKPDAEVSSGHFALVCPDYDATLGALRTAGHVVEPRREHWGSPRSYVRDPAGNLVELMQWPPGAEH